VAYFCRHGHLTGFPHRLASSRGLIEYRARHADQARYIPLAEATGFIRKTANVA
jgi:hypothetical protein